jgi:hypothetical protein
MRPGWRRGSTNMGRSCCMMTRIPSRWNAGLISEGGYFLSRSAGGTVLSKYHLEANIAYWHCVKEDSPKNGRMYLQLYNRLLQLEYSPIAALNRTFALARATGRGSDCGSGEAETGPTILFILRCWASCIPVSMIKRRWSISKRRCGLRKRRQAAFGG